MFRFLIIESKKNLDFDFSVFEDLFSNILDFSNIETLSDSMIIYYKNETDIDFLEFMLNAMSDTLSDLRIYVSHKYHSKAEMINHLSYVKKELLSIPFNKYVYLDDKVLLNDRFHKIDEETKKFILRKYYKDQEMLETVKAYLINNQNMSITAKEIYLHRNTLIQRIDKFIDETGFNVKKFLDAYLIFHILN